MQGKNRRAKECEQNAAAWVSMQTPLVSCLGHGGEDAFRHTSTNFHTPSRALSPLLRPAAIALANKAGKQVGGSLN